MDEFEQALIRVYELHYSVTDVHAKRVNVGGLEGLSLSAPGGAVCMDVYVPLSDRFDVVYWFEFMPAFCHGNGQSLDKMGQIILRSIKFVAENP